MEIEIRFSIGYGRHITSIEVEDDATEQEIEAAVYEEIIQRVDYGWERSA